MAVEQSAQDDLSTKLVGEPPETSGPHGTLDESTAGLASVTAPAVDSTESDGPPLQPHRRFRSALDVADGLGAPLHQTRRPLAWAGVASLLVLGAVAAVWALPRVHREKPIAAAVPSVRPVAAILGFRNELPGKRLGWLSTALEEGLQQELAAAQTVLRVRSTHRVAWSRSSLGVSEDGLSDVKSRSRLQGLIGANRLIHGTLVPAEAGRNAVQLRVEVLDGATGRTLAELSENLGPDAAALPGGLVSLGNRLRDVLRTPLSPEEASVLSVTRVKTLDAAQAHAEGVSSLRAFDYPQARSFFEAALAHDPTLVAAQHRLVESLWRQGFVKRARETAERIASRKDLLTARQSAELETKVAWLGGNGLAARVALFNATPDDADLGLQVALYSASGKQALALVQRLRQLPRPDSEDLRLDAAEAQAVWGDDRKRAEELLDRLQQRARQLGARSEEALSHDVRAALLWGLPGELASFREAIRLHSEVGNLEDLAATKGGLANALSQHGSRPSDAVTALDEAAGAYRRIGHRSALQHFLSLSANTLWATGEAGLARKRLEEARAEADFLGEPPSDTYLWVKPKLHCSDADLAECRAGVKAWAATRPPNAPIVVMFEGHLLLEQDQLEEARASWKRAAAAMEKNGNNLWVTAAALACRARCEQGHAAEGLACLAEIPQTGFEMGEIERDGSEARCKLLSRDALGSETAARRALTASATEYFIDRVPMEIAIASAMAARGQTTKAIPELRRILADIESRRFYKKFAFEAALALGEAEITAGLPAGRARLVRLEGEAKEREHFRIARLAREALDRRPQ